MGWYRAAARTIVERRFSPIGSAVAELAACPQGYVPTATCSK